MNKRPILLFDLDETLINTVNIDSMKFNKKEIKFIIELCIENTIEYIYDKDNNDIIFKRPGLDSFLDWIYSNFNIGVFTKGVPDYATFICKNIIDTKIRRKLFKNQLIFIGTRIDCNEINEKYNNNFNESDNYNDKRLSYISSLFPDRYLILIDNRKIIGLGQENQFLKIEDFDIFNKNLYQDVELERIKRILSEFL
jgi:hypothetical protein